MNADTLHTLFDQVRRIRDISVDVANELARACDKPNNPFGAALEAAIAKAKT